MNGGELTMLKIDQKPAHHNSDGSKVAAEANSCQTNTVRAAVYALPVYIKNLTITSKLRLAENTSNREGGQCTINF